MEKSQCKYCNFIILSSYYFCPNCGKKLHEPPLSISIGKQIGIYLLSFFLPPLGLMPAFRYIKQSDPKSKTVGIIALLLTIISVVISIQLINSLMGISLGQNSSTSIQELRNLGY
nr:hypothetical protein [Candidatus Levybacteria bacterium]